MVATKQALLGFEKEHWNQPKGHVFIGFRTQPVETNRVQQSAEGAHLRPVFRSGEQALRGALAELRVAGLAEPSRGKEVGNVADEIRLIRMRNAAALQGCAEAETPVLRVSNINQPREQRLRSVQTVAR